MTIAEITTTQDLTNQLIKISLLSLDEKEVILLIEHQYGIAHGYSPTSVADMQSSINNCTSKDINILRAALILCKTREYKTKIKRLNGETFNNNSGSETNAILRTTNYSRT